MQRVARAAARALCRISRSRKGCPPRNDFFGSLRYLPMTKEYTNVQGVWVTNSLDDNSVWTPSVTRVPPSAKEPDYDVTTKAITVREPTRYYPGLRYMAVVTPTEISVFAADHSKARMHFQWSPASFPTRVVEPTRYTRLFVGSWFVDNKLYDENSRGGDSC